MKKVFVICLLAAAVALMTACTGAPQNATVTPVPKPSGNVPQAQPAEPPVLPPEPEFEPDILSLVEFEEIEETEEIEEPSPLETEALIAAETEVPLETELSPEPELAEAEAEESPVDITEDPAAVTPSVVQPPVTVSVPEPPAPVTPPATPPPSVAVTPPPVAPPPAPPPPVTPPPPRVTPPVTPPAATPPRVTPPAAPPAPQPAVPQPSAPPEEIPPAVTQPEVEEPPAVSPAPRIVQGIPYPSAGITGRENEEPVFSRTVRAVAGQIVEVPFRGTGWVYLGETNGRRGVFYESRRPDPEGQSFIFRAETAGVYSLKFYRQDFIRNFIFNDYVQLIVDEAPETAGRFGSPVDRGRVVAEPRWPSTVEEAAALRDRRPVSAAADTAQPADSSAETATPPSAATPPSSVTPPAATTPPATTPATPPRTSPPVSPTPATPPATTPSVPAPVVPTTPVPASPAPVPLTPALPPAETSPYAYLEKAGEEYAAGRIVSAISFLDQFRAYFPSGSDEAWWLYGQCYEATSPARNILTALDYYRRLLQDYPQSSRAEETRRRIRYLERLYINIR